MRKISRLRAGRMACSRRELRGIQSNLNSLQLLSFLPMTRAAAC
jgi:hypothetical protein